LENRVIVKKYKLLEPLASGGMATVHLAKNLATDEIVVAKIPNFSGLPNKEKFERRFLREAQILSKINSRYVVKIHDFGKEESTGEYFLILEYLHGKTLEEIAQGKERIPVPTVVDLTMQIAEVLGDLHDQGVVHRDIKSSNIKISSEGNIKLFDFGISKGEDLPSMTRSSDFLGTLQYMSPEQTDGREVDIRSDIYSTGIVIYEMLFGKLPFDAPSPVEVIEMQRHKQPKIPPEAKERGIPASLLSLMFRCLEKNPADRFQTPQELAAALRAVSEDLGMTQSERDAYRKTKLTQIALSSPQSTFRTRARRKQTMTIALTVAGIIAISSGIWLSRGCTKPLEPDFLVAQGELVQYQIPLATPPGTKDIEATISKSPDGLSVKLEKQMENEGENWVLSIYSNLTMPIGVYEIKLGVQYTRDNDLKENEETSFNVGVIKGNLGNKAIRLISSDEIPNDPNSKVENAVKINGKIFVPVETIASGTKAQTEWDRESGKLTYWTPDKTIELKKGEKTLKENGSEKPLNEAPVVLNDSMMVSGNVAETYMDTAVTSKNDSEIELTFKQSTPGSKISISTKDEKGNDIKGAIVLINQNYKGKTPIKIELPNGVYQIKIQMGGFNDINDEIKLVTTKTLDLSYPLVAIQQKPPEQEKKPPVETKPKQNGFLDLSVNVPWGSFIVDGKTQQNITSLSLELAPGKHKVVYRLKDFPDQTKDVQIEPGRRNSVKFQISSGILKVTCNVVGIVYIDNIEFSDRIFTSPKEPYIREVAAKTYIIRVDKSGYKMQTKSVKVEPGKTTTVEFNLEPK